MRNIFSVSVLIFFLMGCQTPGFVIPETHLPAKQTRVAITSVVGEPRAISQNGREILSQYHDRKIKFLDVTAQTKERLYTKVTILGARRPYDISVEVHVERRDPETKIFQDIGLDDGLARSQALLIKQALNQSRDKIQSIDEGSPF